MDLAAWGFRGGWVTQKRQPAQQGVAWRGAHGGGRHARTQTQTLRVEVVGEARRERRNRPSPRWAPGPGGGRQSGGRHSATKAGAARARGRGRPNGSAQASSHSHLPSRPPSPIGPSFSTPCLSGAVQAGGCRAGPVPAAGRRTPDGLEKKTGHCCWRMMSLRCACAPRQLAVALQLRMLLPHVRTYSFPFSVF